MRYAALVPETFSGKSPLDGTVEPLSRLLDVAPYDRLVREILQAALGRAVKMLALGSLAGLGLGLLATRILVFIVYQATPGDPLILSSALFAMALLGLVATWILAQRALY